MRYLRAAINGITERVRGAEKRLRRWVRRNRPSLLITLLITLFVTIYFWPYIFIRIKSGEGGVHYKLFAGGTVIDRVYGEGMQVIFPWDTMHVYNVRVQEREHNVELLSESGLKLQFLLSIRYHPEYDMLGVLHQRVGPEYVENIVIPQVVSVLRTHVGQHSAEEVVTTQRAILERVFTSAIEQVAQRYITIDQVIIRTITLPPPVQKAIEDKIEQKHVAEAHEFRLLKEQKEAKRRLIEAEGYKTYNETIAESLTEDILKWKGIEATREIATSENGKIIVIGNGDKGLPIILGGVR